MKKLAITLALATAIASVGCGTDSRAPLTYVARTSSDSTPHLFILNESTQKSTEVTIPIPSTAWYVAANSAATEVAYYRSDSTGYDLFLMGKDGTEKPLTSDGHSWGAAFSPNGKTIAYVDYATGPNQIFLMNADGTNQHALWAPVTDQALLPAFSPDGTSIVFYVEAGAPVFAAAQTHRHNALSGAPLPDMQNRNSKGAAHRLAQSQIAEPSQSGWYSMALTDTTPTLVFASSSWWGPAVYSADGKKLLLTMYDGNQDNIFSVSPLDGTGTATPLTTSTTTANFSAVPYRNLILFNQWNSATTSFDIYVMDQTGGNQTLVHTTANTYESLLDAFYSLD